MKWRPLPPLAEWSERRAWNWSARERKQRDTFRVEKAGSLLMTLSSDDVPMGVEIERKSNPLEQPIPCIPQSGIRCCASPFSKIVE